MSREDVERVRRSWEAWERGDMAAIFAFYDPEIVWDMTGASGMAVLSATYHGHDGVRQFFREWREPFESYHAHAEELVDAGGGCVLVRAQQGGRGKGSGAEVEMPTYWQVYRLRDGRAVRVEIYSVENEAREAVGLSERRCRAQAHRRSCERPERLGRARAPVG